LAGASGAEADEALEDGEVLDVDGLPDFALQIGRDVCGHPVARGDSVGVDGRIATREQKVVEPGKGQGTGGQLANRE
jgi:hypothetical protein